MLEQFHFLEPLWLLALIPLAALFCLAFQAHTDSRAWEKIIDAKLLPLLLQGKDNNKHRLPKFLLAITWVIAVIALADPVWEKIPRPIFQTNAARVLVLDLSNSMLIDDIKPSRIARARFKIEDILAREEEGQTGLVLFAGEAFTAAPLTRDTDTISSMLKVLTPQIMPAQGSRADLGLAKAHELLKQAGIVNGQILLIADGVSDKSASLKAANALAKDGHTVSVMAVGTEAGGTLNFRNNTSQLIKLDAEGLENIAKNGGGNYRLMTTNNSDLKSLLNPITDKSSLDNKQEKGDNNLQNSDWYSTGPFLVLLLLPFAALAFRKGWLFNVAVAFFAVALLVQPQELLAADDSSQVAPQVLPEGNWDKLVERLSKNRAQRANNALLNKQYEKAKDLSKDPLTRGSAEYKLENYEDALSSFQESQGATARYNEGNTQAKLKNYKEALAAYDRALKLDPTLQDASDNKKAIEEFLKQQEQQSGKDGDSSNENQQGNSDSKNDEQKQEGGESKDQQDKQSGSQSADENGEQKQQEDKKQEGDKSDENQFSEANEDLEKNKKEADEEELKSAQSQSDQKSDSADEKAQALSDSKIDEVSKQEAENDKNKPKPELKEAAEELSQEEKMAAEQWLRRIPDDPGGLLRRKFRYQYNQNRRNNSNSNATEQPW